MKKSKKPLTGAQKRKQKREQREREENERRELVEGVERLKLGPSPLWKFIVDHRDIFEAHVLLSGKLNRSDIKMFYECCRASRRAVMRAKIELKSCPPCLRWRWRGIGFLGARGKMTIGSTTRITRWTKIISQLESAKRTISRYLNGPGK